MSIILSIFWNNKTDILMIPKDSTLFDLYTIYYDLYLSQIFEIKFFDSVNIILDLDARIIDDCTLFVLFRKSNYNKQDTSAIYVYLNQNHFIYFYFHVNILLIVE